MQYYAFAVAITGWIANLFEAHPATAQLVGVIITLVGAFRFLIPIILAVSNFMGGGLIGRIIALVSKFGLLRAGLTILKRCVHVIKRTIKNYISYIPIVIR
ncbi:hypothetical protein HIL15_15035 [Staphylococcus aureus]|nr:hypothetical protein [Staphylococcus aureus]